MISMIDTNIIGRSTAINEVRELIKINAQYPAPVLITGETGTGKELAARGLHYGGIFAGKPFIAINCSTFTDELFASELFGYKKGAFTDAKVDKEGLLNAARGGSIFLDEIDSLSMKSQTVLLRLLQESEFRAVGCSKTQNAEVRIIAAANCDLQNKISEGSFRQDLYFRLFILNVKMPPLRERKEDLAPLCHHFIDKLNAQYGLGRSGISDALMDKFANHHWPGNVRELENTIHRYYLLARNALIGEGPASEFVQSGRACSGMYETAEVLEYDDDEAFDFGDAKRKAIEVFEQRFVSRVLQQAGGNVTKAASLCGKERSAFGKLIKKYNIDRDNMRQ